MRILACMFLTICTGCNNSTFVSPVVRNVNTHSSPKVSMVKKFNEKSWPYFLQHLPVVDGPVIDYMGREINDQDKHFGIIPYDIGKKDLQQCADAIIRIRAEYLFEQKRFDEIGFHFTSGQWYAFNDFCNGILPATKGNKVVFVEKNASLKTHESLRRYLDYVYMYAGTISLAKELKATNQFEVGTVVIYGGSPGHCFIIIDEAVNEKGEKVFKLAEGYTPAQSIYVLRNIREAGKTPWYQLNKGVIRTSSYIFTDYKMGKFE